MTGRKQHVKVSAEAVIEYARRVGVTTIAQVAGNFQISTSTARRKLDAGVWRDELVRDEFDAQGVALHHTLWRYARAD